MREIFNVSKTTPDHSVCKTFCCMLVCVLVWRPLLSSTFPSDAMNFVLNCNGYFCRWGSLKEPNEVDEAETVRDRAGQEVWLWCFSWVIMLSRQKPSPWPPQTGEVTWKHLSPLCFLTHELRPEMGWRTRASQREGEELKKDGLEGGGSYLLATYLINSSVA